MMFMSAMEYIYLAANLAFWTIIIETSVMLFIYSKVKNLKRILVSSIIINLMTNAVLNCVALPSVYYLVESIEPGLSISNFFYESALPIIMAIFELIIVCVEYCCYLSAFKMKDADIKDKWKLLGLVLLANIFSYGLGFNYFI